VTIPPDIELETVSAIAINRAQGVGCLHLHRETQERVAGRGVRGQLQGQDGTVRWLCPRQGNLSRHSFPMLFLIDKYFRLNVYVF
jgi:hypothetical protein